MVPNRVIARREKGEGGPAPLLREYGINRWKEEK
jgi:hypothetical protein